MIGMDFFVIGFIILGVIGTPVQVEYVPSEELSDIEKDALALELYLKDKEDYKKHCPNIKWDQPDINSYKQNLKSKLPENCKK